MVDPKAALLAPDDLGAVRGDGVFETIHVRGGRPFGLDAHLARMARSAERLEFALPGDDRLRAMAMAACAEFGDQAEGALRLVATRGPETGGDPTVYCTLSPVPAATIALRNAGLRVVTLSLGYLADSRAKAPWLLGGAKTLSYAVTMAALRHAKNTGYDDALWVSEDGYALEGPTATLVWLVDDTLYTVPADTGILIGTTAAYLFDHARELGLRTDQARIRPQDLARTDGVWLTSSTRGVAPVLTLDGMDMAQSPQSARLQELSGYPRS